MIKFQLLATKVGNTIKTVGTYWILDSINGRATGVPPVTVRGLDHRTEEYARSPATQSRNHPLLDNSEQDNPVVGATNHTLSRIKRKGTSRQGSILLSVGATHEALLHLPCFSHSRLMRLEATITFIGHIT